MKVYQRIKEEREKKKFSQSYLALELKLDQSQYSRRENGAIPLTVNELLKIAEILGVKPEKFFATIGDECSVAKPDESIVKIITLYEICMKEKDERIALLTYQLNNKV
ncbi:hypothetical protein DMB65_06710 [Flavobacterium cheongpyeongense]|uniref:HTH cro/C1-type domain-containing protein n=1 Tax=Flavobacterium cheongpyeongense TaxID=2212651 RepID=A0A2V4BRC8_9FLAO|nr:helix-turn-helix transcriptional regulator [Flavobacterium cheongpyeongense]PXY41636.1 hypothetical protein DMB65_06710 [Flavobacterium cheongpyeongense]